MAALPLQERAVRNFMKPLKRDGRRSIDGTAEARKGENANNRNQGASLPPSPCKTPTQSKGRWTESRSNADAFLSMNDDEVPDDTPDNSKILRKALSSLIDDKRNAARRSGEKGRQIDHLEREVDELKRQNAQLEGELANAMATGPSVSSVSNATLEDRVSELEQELLAARATADAATTSAVKAAATASPPSVDAKGDLETMTAQLVAATAVQGSLEAQLKVSYDDAAKWKAKAAAEAKARAQAEATTKVAKADDAAKWKAKAEAEAKVGSEAQAVAKAAKAEVAVAQAKEKAAVEDAEQAAMAEAKKMKAALAEALARVDTAQARAAEAEARAAEAEARAAEAASLRQQLNNCIGLEQRNKELREALSEARGQVMRRRTGAFCHVLSHFFPATLPLSHSLPPSPTLSRPLLSP